MWPNISYLGIRSAWLLPLRLITFCLVAGIIVGRLGFPSYLHTPFFTYCIITLAVLVSLLVFRSKRYSLLCRCLIGLQFAGEVLVEVGIVYTTGTHYSPFSALFLLTIVSAALAYRLVGTLVVASMVSLAYAGTTWVMAFMLAPGSGDIPSLKESLFSGDDTLFYAIFLHILIFYLVAFIAGYMAQKLQSKDKELHSASTELKKVRLETDDILQHLNCGLVTLDAAGDIVYFNRTAETILGCREGDVSGQHCRRAFDGRLSRLADILLSALESEEWSSRSEFDIVISEEKTVPLGISTSVLYDEDFGIRGVIAIFQDLTEPKLLEEKVRRADRMAAIGELSACIAHEIRNPLAAISGSVEVLKNDLALEGVNDKLMSLILKETARLNNILSDFLLYARVGRSQLRKVELNRIISDVIELVRQHPSYRDTIRIELIAEHPVTYISGDDDQLKQLLLNLVVNACDAIEGGDGRIRFEVSSGKTPDGEDAVWLMVRDNGPGIPPDQLDKIFLPFFSTKRNGTGLGLSIVARLMEALDGKIDVSSREEQGTTFRLQFRGIVETTAARSTNPAPPVTFPQ